MKVVHVPVMQKEVIDLLQIKANGFYIDCTLGDGGHSNAILKKLNSNGMLLSMDQDQKSIDFVTSHYETSDQLNWIIKHENFKNMAKLLKQLKKDGKIPKEKFPDGILMDLGLSSRQIEKDSRGFSYIEEKQSLDMRMDQRLSVTAKDLLTVLSVRELKKLFEQYGEERYANRIAKMIKANQPIETVQELNRAIYKALPTKNISRQKKHPARRVFQALRIAVNDELNSLQTGLEQGWDLLNKNGHFVVISFHSLEDRIVKNFFTANTSPKENASTTPSLITPTDAEINQNPRARSAKLRVLQKA